MKVYEVYCGNFDCSARAAGRTFQVPDAELLDGELWLCPQCRPATRRPARKL